jgi:serine/threonine-protein kinase
VLLVMVVAALFMARRNLPAGRGDRKGASRLAAAVFVIHLIAFVLGAHHVTESGEIPLVGIAVAIGLLKAALLWVGYVALEPFARRRWPHTLISWSRLLDGRWRDPLVGRDVLMGLAFGAVCTLFLGVGRWDSTFAITPSASIQSVRTLLAAIVNLSAGAVQSTLGTFLLLFLLRILARRDWIAVLLGAAIFSLPNGLAAANPPLGFALGFVMNFIAFALVARAGLTALLAFLWTLTVAGSAPFTTDTTSWYFNHALLIAIIVAGLGMIAFRHALAGRPVFADAH